MGMRMGTPKHMLNWSVQSCCYPCGFNDLCVYWPSYPPSSLHNNRELGLYCSFLHLIRCECWAGTWTPGWGNLGRDFPPKCGLKTKVMWRWHPHVYACGYPDTSDMHASVYHIWELHNHMRGGHVVSGRSYAGPAPAKSRLWMSTSVPHQSLPEWWHRPALYYLWWWPQLIADWE